MIRWRRRLLVALVALLAATGACGGDERSDDGGAATTTTAGTGSGTTEEGSARATAASAPTGPAEDGHVIEVTIAGGVVEGGPRREKVELGSEITLRFTSDVADEVHVHTYDRTLDLVPGQTMSVSFVADIPGIHEVELHDRGRKVLDLEVS